MSKILALALLAFSLAATAQQGLTGQLAPDFTLPDQDGQMHSLSDYRGKWLVMYFYPRDDTPGCTVEAQAFRDAKDQFDQKNTVILGVSTDDVESHQAFHSKYGLNFDLLADDDNTVTEAYDVLGGVALIRYAKRQTFIIDPEGNVVKHFEDVDPNTHVEQVMTALNDIQSMANA
ncbi:MAG: peroxiredoxin [Lysobacteraceae bacterium]|nr:MAG: peroxiredoxin [Xanthomonadaceae bacterium]